jgi:hypothetical protein
MVKRRNFRDWVRDLADQVGRLLDSFGPAPTPVPVPIRRPRRH